MTTPAENPNRRFVEVGGFSTSPLNIVPQHVDIVIRCGACLTMRAIDRTALEAVAGPHRDLRDIERRMRCLECGEKQARILTGYYGSG